MLDPSMLTGIPRQHIHCRVLFVERAAKPEVVSSTRRVSSGNRLCGWCRPERGGGSSGGCRRDVPDRIWMKSCN